jgi:hypothetical protein
MVRKADEYTRRGTSQHPCTEGEPSMITRPALALALAACLLPCAHFHNNCNAQQQTRARLQDDVLGIAFREIGTVEKTDNSTYRMTLQPSEYPQTAYAQVSVTDRLYVDLPATYGGRIYLDTPPSSRIISNRVLTDSVNTGRHTFIREYWTVYAGMGMWEAVINCYAHEGGRYYVVSLVQDAPSGKPGEERNGRPIVGEDVRRQLLNSLRDTTNVMVKEFTALLASIEIQRQ